MVRSDPLPGTAPSAAYSWEQQTRSLIAQMQKERLKAEQRRLNAERQVAEFDAKIGALEWAIDYWRDMHGMAKAPLVVTPEQAALYKGIPPKEMLLRWADAHGGEVVMKDAAAFLAAAGLFTDAPQAAGTLYPTIKRMDEFEKRGRGVYRRKSANWDRPKKFTRTSEG